MRVVAKTFDVLSRLFVLACLPAFLIFFFFYCLICLIIDAISEFDDSLHLSESKARMRETDRNNARRYRELDMAVNYLKFVFAPH